MDRSVIRPVIITSIISLLLIIGGIIPLCIFKEVVFKWKDPTGEIRNILLPLIGIGGIPFLILGHLTKRRDIESKQQDLMFRTETIQMENMLKKLNESCPQIKEIFKIDFSMMDYDLHTRDGSHILTFFHIVWSSSGETIMPRYLDNARNSISFEFDQWEQLSKHITTICHCIRLKRNLRNPELRNMISIDLINLLQEDHLTNLLYVTSLRDFGHIEGSNSNPSDTDLILGEMEELENQKLVHEGLLLKASQIPLKLIESEGLLRGREK